ncbi:TPA: type 1 glutamine amidotransferase [Candidatus Woesearchaeota archaeon]|nr:type 1 glutamine amidotransferase [Candidatus Woesearchaeota archaeon]HIH05314.1 type 1 glutamine amidotransferase [Candidatus Woesearchaeota archaeon]HII66322.1 type 1 glutamine amidotransferase [Candidatus Woesearchaeota archaeon]HIJ19126.1 type 1 glutamine amidotransferase [Candidatus Woesearchaeota archaeon]
MKVLIIKNKTTEGPGLLKGILDSHGIGYDIADLGRGEQFPDPGGYDALFVFGGPDSANDNTPKMKDELKRIRQALDADIPFLGVCLGMQALVKAAGGEVVKNAVKETGWRGPDGGFFQMEATEEGETDPLFGGLPSLLPVFHLHGETVVLAEGMALLATGKHCTNQAVKVGERAYGIQGHLELTPPMLEEWMRHDPDLMPLDKDALRKDYAALRGMYEISGTKLLENFLGIAGIIG